MKKPRPKKIAGGAVSSWLLSAVEHLCDDLVPPGCVRRTAGL